jgi:hypothetical protein
MDNVTPIRPGLPVLERSPFDELRAEMMVWLNALSCACTTLGLSDAIDQDESASRARAVALSCDANLHRLMNKLEAWEIQTRQGAAPAVGS